MGQGHDTASIFRGFNLHGSHLRGKIRNHWTNMVNGRGRRGSIFQGGLNELAPAIMNGEAETTILDVPDALIALEKWPGEIKVIGPISPKQQMGCGFAKKSPKLRKAFNSFFEKCKADGTYYRLVKKYYPAVFIYFSEFFEDM